MAEGDSVMRVRAHMPFAIFTPSPRLTVLLELNLHASSDTYQSTGVKGGQNPSLAWMLTKHLC